MVIKFPKAVIEAIRKHLKQVQTASPAPTVGDAEEVQKDLEDEAN
jgi:hypothetical protein